MSITEFLDKLGPEGRRRADALIQFIALGVLSLLFWHGMGIANASWGNELTVLHVPMAVQYLGLPFGSGLMAIFIAWDLVEILRGRPRQERYEAA